MKIFDNIGLGLFVISILSVMLWSPRHHLVFHELKPIPIQLEPHLENNNNVQQENNDNRASQHNYPNWVEDWGNKAGILLPHIELNTEREEISRDKDSLEKIERHGKYGASTNFDSLTNNVDNGNGNGNMFMQSPTSFQQKATNFVKDKESNMIDNVGAAIERTDEWISNHAHGVYEKSSEVSNILEDKVDTLYNATFHRMETEKAVEPSSDNYFNIFGSSIEDPNHKDGNENNVENDYMQTFSATSTEGDANEYSNIHNSKESVHIETMEKDAMHTSEDTRDVEVGKHDDTYGVDNLHQNSQEPEDAKRNLIEQSVTKVNNLWTTIVGDGDGPSKGNKESISSNGEQPIYHQNEGHEDVEVSCNGDEACMKEYKEVRSFHHEAASDPQHEEYHNGVRKNYYKGHEHSMDDDYFKKNTKKYSSDVYDRTDRRYKRHTPQQYLDDAHQYGEEKYNNAKNKIGEYYKGFRTGYGGAKIGGRVGNALDGIHGAYKGGKFGGNVGYKVVKNYQGAKNRAHEYYTRAREKVRDDSNKRIRGRHGHKGSYISENSNYEPYEPSEDYDEDEDDDYEYIPDIEEMTAPDYGPEIPHNSKEENKIWDEQVGKVGQGNPSTSIELEEYLNFVRLKILHRYLGLDIKKDKLEPWIFLMHVAQTTEYLSWTWEMEKHLRKLEAATGITYEAWAFPNRRDDGAATYMVYHRHR